MSTVSTALGPTAGTSAGRQDEDVHVDSDEEIEVEVEVMSGNMDDSSSTSPVSGPSDKDSNDSAETITITLDSEDDEEGDGVSRRGTVTINSGGLIRIRNEGDGIFEKEEEDDEEDRRTNDISGVPGADADADFGSPEKKKRKQELTLDLQAGGNGEEFKDELEFFDYFPMSPLSPDIFGIPVKDRIPLYSMDPKDFAHDPQKQQKIRKAIITYNHHQRNKAQLVMLREADRRLRDHIVDLKSKIQQLANCGCPLNSSLNLKVLEVNIPVVPPRTFSHRLHGTRHQVPVPFQNYLLSSVMDPGPGVKPGEGPDNQQYLPMKPIGVEVEIPPVKEDKDKPVINITSVGLQQQISPASMAPIIASRPPSSNVITYSNRSKIRTTVNGSTPPPAPALSYPTSRIVYSRPPGPGIMSPGPGNHPGGQQTASQLLFGAKQNVMINSPASPNGLNEQSVPRHPILMPVQPPAISTSGVIGPRGPPPPPLTAAPRMALFVTSTGQVIGRGLVTSSPTQLGNSVPQKGANPGPGMIRVQPQQPPRSLQVIRPKPAEPRAPLPVLVQAVTRAPVPAPIPSVTRDSLKSFWSRSDDENEDEASIIASITGGKPVALADLRNSRKQKMVKRDHRGSEEIVMEENSEPSPPAPGTSKPKKSNVLHSRGMKIDLGKYADVVFEEAD